MKWIGNGEGHTLLVLTDSESRLIRACLESTPGSEPAGRATFRDSEGNLDHVSPVAALAVCRVRRDWYRNGQLLSKGKAERQVCGVLTYTEEGFGICEEMGNFAGYLQPGQELGAK